MYVTGGMGRLVIPATVRKNKQTNEQKPPPNAIHILNAQQQARLFPAYVQTRGDV